MITLTKALKLFEIDQELKGNTKETILNYQRNLKYFIDYVGSDKLIDDLCIGDVKDYQLYLSKKDREFNFKTDIKMKLSKTTIQTYIRHIRAFINWLYSEDYLTKDIGSKIKLPKAQKKTIEILSDEEIEKIYNSINAKTEFGLRNKCMISLMLDSGLRRSEVLMLDIDNVHFKQNIIKVSGKGQKERIVPIGLYTKKLLYKYMHGYRSLPYIPTARVFISQEKTPVSKDVIKMLFYRLKRKTNITRLKPHLLRHTFATKYLINGGDIFSLQMILGHSSLDMTRRYSHIASSYVVDNFVNLSTLDRLRGRKVSL
ncbi:tyrosine-type recombinase/integrase [Clostridiaceae bacterium M8S5]|nr:tyrosine-type recombinase/integrase [Clostridiaceae bacterium M8S5]